MDNKCPRITDPSQCVKCRSMAQELLTRGNLSGEEREKVKTLLRQLRDNRPIDDESRDFLNDLAVRYLE